MKIVVHTGFEQVGGDYSDSIDLFPDVERIVGWLNPQEAKRLAFELDRAADRATDRERGQAAARIGTEK